MNETTPDSNGTIRVYPNDPNTVDVFTFYLVVHDEKKPVPNQELFGPYTLDLTCANNVISPVLNISG